MMFLLHDSSDRIRLYFYFLISVSASSRISDTECATHNDQERHITRSSSFRNTRASKQATNDKPTRAQGMHVPKQSTIGQPSFLDTGHLIKKRRLAHDVRNNHAEPQTLDDPDDDAQSHVCNYVVIEKDMATPLLLQAARSCFPPILGGTYNSKACVIVSF